MKKYKMFIFPAFCVLVVVVTFALLINLKNKVEEMNYNVNTVETNSNNEEEIESNEENNNNDQNKVTNNIDNNIDGNTSKNEVSNKIVSPSDVYEQEDDVGSTDKKQEAINLVKQKWGKDDTVTFRCDSVKANGEYVIAVISKSSASVKNYFIVNLEKRTVQVDY